MIGERLPSARRWGQSLLLLFVVAGLALELLAWLGVGCDPLYCHLLGYRLGFRLFWGCLAFAVVGEAVFDRRLLNVRGAGLGLFTLLGLGLVTLMLYVYLRSMFNHLALDIPISRAEIYGLLVVSMAWIVWRERRLAAGLADSGLRGRWNVFALVLLLLLCVVIADRELPRAVLLSSDPDFHAFFGKQVERLGGVPFAQQQWGGAPFNYPAGSGVILFLWKKFTGLDQVNLLTVLPLLFSYLAGWLVVERLPLAADKPVYKAMLLVVVLALVSAGFLFPLYPPFAHMESSARQMSILFGALLVSLLVGGLGAAPPGQVAALRWLAPAVVLFVLLILNPANIAIPGVILAALFALEAYRGRWRFDLALVFVAGFALTVMEPFYQGLMGMVRQVRTDTVVYDASLVVKDLPRIVADTLSILSGEVPRFFHELMVLFSEDSPYYFLSLFAFYLVCLLPFLSKSRQEVRAAAVFLGVMGVSLYLVYGLSNALRDDRRFFLLAPYIFFNLTQYKALLLTAMAGMVLVQAMNRSWHWVWVLLLCAVVFLPQKMLIRSSQDMFLDARQSYCGSLGCLPDDDQRLLAEIHRLLKEGALTGTGPAMPKVLLPNSVAKMALETWIFPVSSARVFPFHEELPAAFYYYQGDAEYGTASYLERVCQRLDRAWLKSKGIAYVYLPSERKEACLAGMEDLVRTEQVVLRVGGAYLLKLQEPSSAQAAVGGQ